jgi:hypothetical protein
MDLLGDEMAKGDFCSPANPFHFDTVRLNLPSSSSYDPRLPWVSKLVSSSGCIAGDVKTYMDDKHPTGSSYCHCHQVARRTVSLLGYLGMQDTSTSLTVKNPTHV